MTKTVYILTREGRGYKDEGLEIARNEIFEIFHDDSDFLFMAGQFLNDPKKLIKRLSENKDGYLLLSMEDGGYYFTANDFPDLIAVIEKHPDENPWEVLNAIISEARRTVWPKEKEEKEE